MKRYVYIGDVHGNVKLTELVKKFDDGSTFFVFAGDFFDRGEHSFEVAETIKELLRKGICGGVLGNHDLLFVVPKVFPESEQAEWYFNAMLFPTNGGEATLDSFIKNTLPENARDLAACDVSEEDANVTKTYVSELAKLLFENFGTYYVDPLGNLTVHGGIPFLGNGEAVGERFDDFDYFGLDYVKKLDGLFRTGDEETLKKFRGWYPNGKILSFLNEKYGTNYSDWFQSDYKNYVHTWFGNQLYDENEDVRIDLRKELDKHGLKKMFVGHVGNQNADFGKSNFDDFIFRLDRSFIVDEYGNKGIGYCVLSDANEVLEIGTF